MMIDALEWLNVLDCELTTLYCIYICWCRDSSICRRKLLNVQKIRERQNSLRGRHHRSSTRSPVDASSLLNSDRRGRMSTDNNSLCESMATSVHIGGSNASPMQISAATPPIHISESSSATSSQVPQAHPFDVGASTGPYSRSNNSSSSSHLPNLQQQQQQQYAQFGHAIMVTDSPQVSASYTSMDADSFSLERPGFFPGVDASIASQTSTASYHSSSTTHTAASQLASSQTFGSYQGRFSATTSMYSSYSTAQQAGPPRVVIPSQTNDAVSVTSSIAMSEPPMVVDPQQMVLMQQQMALFHQQQQQQQYGFIPVMQPMQPTPPQQQQPPGATAEGIQPAIAPQQHHHAPMMMMQSPGGGPGVYYVATSATGQPVLLQPVGLWNNGGTDQQPPTGAGPNTFVPPPNAGFQYVYPGNPNAPTNTGYPPQQAPPYYQPPQQQQQQPSYLQYPPQQQFDVPYTSPAPRQKQQQQQPPNDPSPKEGAS